MWKSPEDPGKNQCPSEEDVGIQQTSQESNVEVDDDECSPPFEQFTPKKSGLSMTAFEVNQDPMMNEIEVESEDPIDNYYNNQSTCETPVEDAESSRKSKGANNKNSKSKDVEVSDCGEKKPKSRRPRRQKEIQTSTVCHVCGHLAKSRAAMYYHNMYVHEKQKRFICVTCGKGFCQKLGLKLHERTHTGEKPFACNICDKRFSQQGSLKYHTVVHTGQKNFPCNMCSMCLTSKSSLTRHIKRAHTERSLLFFPCPELTCRKVFRHKGFLETHKKLAHLIGGQGESKSVKNEKKKTEFPCDVCDAVFQTKKLLGEHDHKEHFRPYACFKCPRRFAESAVAKAHFLEAHGITVFPLTKDAKRVKMGEPSLAAMQSAPAVTSALDNDTPPVIKSVEISKPNSVASMAIEKVGQTVYLKTVLSTHRTRYRELSNPGAPSSTPSLSSNPCIVKTESTSDEEPEPNLKTTSNHLRDQPKTKVLIIRKKVEGSSSNSNSCDLSNVARVVRTSWLLRSKSKQV